MLRVIREGRQAGSVDVLVNNAGFSWIGPTAELEVATFDRLIAANVRAPCFVVAALAPKMTARWSGSVTNIGSQSAQIGMARLAADSATKGALAALTRSWAAEFSPAGVRINTVISGPVSPASGPDSVTEQLRYLRSPPMKWWSGALTVGLRCRESATLASPCAAIDALSDVEYGLAGRLSSLGCRAGPTNPIRDGCS